MNWTRLLLLAAVLLCVAVLFVPRPPRFARASLPRDATRPPAPRRRRPIWPVEIPTDIQLPVPLGEPFEPLTEAPAILPWSLDTDNLSPVAKVPSLYGAASPGPRFGLLRDNVPDSLLGGPVSDDTEAQYAAALERSPLQPETTRITLRPWQDALPTLSPAEGGGEPLMPVR